MNGLQWMHINQLGSTNTATAMLRPPSPLSRYLGLFLPSIFSHYEVGVPCIATLGISL